MKPSGVEGGRSSRATSSGPLPSSNVCSFHTRTDWVPSIYELTQAATLATMLFELGAPVMIVLTYLHATRDRGGRLRWINKLRLRWIWIATGVGFHLGIAVTLRLGIFPWGMLSIYPVLFHPSEITCAEAKVTALWRRRSKTP